MTESKVCLVKKGNSFKPEVASNKWIYHKHVSSIISATAGSLFKDQYTDGILKRFEGRAVNTKRIGRGEGLCDGQGLKLFSDIDPSDAQQREIGDCWLMCCFAAVAEFDGMIADLFEQKKISSDGKYTIKLFDLPSKVTLRQLYVVASVLLPVDQRMPCFLRSI